ncbi:hypothetical protein FOZG_16804 [Fusarium oxysporum Fo47]|uniref:Uncharacterized protein n=1 Tax=Fusarium oxysporum Fo47 TaxID=660027 RepID=W9JJX5_FUSOX|nr:hypothetical protein FOZG_16804 [Fusarium oxysporum Fo47]
MWMYRRLGRGPLTLCVGWMAFLCWGELISTRPTTDRCPKLTTRMASIPKPTNSS